MPTRPGPLRTDDARSTGTVEAPPTTSSPTPFNGFQNIRGALFTTPGTGFLQAPPAGLDTFFGRADGFYDAIFDPFSAQRVFTPVGSNITDTTFFIPGTNGASPATVTAFGAVFLDADEANVSSLQFFDVDGVSLGTFFVPAVTEPTTRSRSSACSLTAGRSSPRADYQREPIAGTDKYLWRSSRDGRFHLLRTAGRAGVVVSGFAVSGASMVVWRMRRKQRAALY